MRKLIIVLLYLYVLFTLIFPALFVNKVIFALIIALFVLSYAGEMNVLYAPIALIAIFIYGYVLSLFNVSNDELARQFTLSSAAVLLIFPIDALKIDFEKAVRFGCNCFLIVDLLYVLYAISINSFHLMIPVKPFAEAVAGLIPNQFFTALEAYSETAMGMRAFIGEFDVMAHLGALPILYLGIALNFESFLENRKVRHLLFVGAALYAILCGKSRALIILAVMIMLFLFLRRISHRKGLYYFVLLSLLAAVVAAAVYLFTETSVFDIGEESNARKIDHIASTFGSISFLQALFGKGTGTYFYSNSLGIMMAHTEITLLDFFRYFGFPLALAIYYTISFPVSPGRIKGTDLAIFLGYLILSLTNPVLFNSVGMIVVIWYWHRSINRPFRVEHIKDDTPLEVPEIAARG